MKDTADVLEFVVKDSHYCVEISNVAEVISIDDELDDPEDEEQDFKLSNLPYSTEYLLGVTEYRDETLEVIDTKAVFNLGNQKEKAIQEERREMDEEIKNTFNEIQEALNDNLKQGDVSESAGKEFEELFVRLHDQVLNRPDELEDTDYTKKNIIVLAKEVGPTERRIGLLVDEARDVFSVGPENLDTSARGKGVFGAVRNKNTMIVWIDPAEGLENRLEA